MRKLLLHAAACALVLASAVSASAAANFVYHEQTNNFVATPTCPSGGTDTAGGRYVENTDRSGAAGFQIYSPETYRLKFKVEFQFFTNQWRVFYTTDGTTPTANDNCVGGACNPTPAGTTQMVTATFHSTYSDQTQSCQNVDIIAASIPPQPAGTTVKYIVAAYHSGGGDVIYANSGECSACFECNSGTTGCATVFQYSTIAAPSTPLIISEFRWHGTNGADDEFIEIYNNSNSDVTVNAFDGSAGFALAKSGGTTLFTIPNGTVIPARGHYLGCNSTPTTGYSLTSYPAGNGTTATCDATYTGSDALPLNVGIALFNTANSANFNTLSRLDAVGSTLEANTLYREGAGVHPIVPFNTNNSYYRDIDSGTHQDTGVNANDFLFVDTNGTCSLDPNGDGNQGDCPPLDGTRRGRHLGAPGPENLSSPIQRNASMPFTLPAPCVSSNSPPNRVRDASDTGTNAFFGTLSIRRTITNNTGANVTRLRFRVANITTFPDGNFSGSPNADLRVMSSTLSVEAQPCGGGVITIQGLTLEQASAPNDQPNGGGYNSSLSAGTITLATPLPPTDNPATVGVVENQITVNFRMGVQAKGNARFFVTTEVLP